MITLTITKQDLIDAFDYIQLIKDDGLDVDYCSKCVLAKSLNKQFELIRPVLVFDSGISIPGLNEDYNEYCHSEETKEILDDFDYMVEHYLNDKEYQSEYEALLNKLPITTTIEKKHAD